MNIVNTKLVGGKFIRSLARVRDNEGKLVMRSGQLAYLVEHGFVEQVEGVISNSREWGYYRLTDKGAQALVGDFHQPNKGQDYARLRRRVANQRREITRLLADMAAMDRLWREWRQLLAEVGQLFSVDELNRRVSSNPSVDEAAALPVVEWEQGSAELMRAERLRIQSERLQRGSGAGQRKFRIDPGHYARMVGIDLASGPDRSFETTVKSDGDGGVEVVDSVEIVDGVVPVPEIPSECSCGAPVDPENGACLGPITREEILGGWQWRNDRGERQAESIAAWIREFFETGKPTLKMPDMESTHALEYWLNLAAKEAVAAALEIEPFPAEDAFSGHVRQGFKAAQSMEPWSKCLTLVIASMLRASVALRRGETRL